MTPGPTASVRRAGRVRRRLAAAGGVTALVAGLLLVWAPPALAHAVLEQSDPAPDTVVDQPPGQVALTFGEPVEVTPHDVRVYDDHIRRVDVGTAHHPRGDASTVVVALAPRLHRGTYTVTWRVTSLDSHIVTGSFVFSVGAPSRVLGAAPAPATDTTVTVLQGVDRAVGYAGLAAGPGALLVALALWPAGLADGRARRLVRAGALTLLGSAVVAAVLQALAELGAPLSALGQGRVWSQVVGGERANEVLLARVVLAAATAVVVGRVLGPAAADDGPTAEAGPARRSPIVDVAVLVAALLVTWPLAGHAGVGSLVALSVAADWLHVAAMTVWLGGLALLAVALRTGADLGDLGVAVRRFSSVAFGCVTVLVATGVYASWREVGTLAALPATPFGRLLLAKGALVVLLVALARLAQRWVRRRLPEPALPAFRRGLLAETGVAAAVLGVTAALTGTAQASEAYAPAVTVTAHGPIDVRVHVDRAHTGPATLTFTVTDAAGQPQPFTRIGAEITQVAKDMGPFLLTVTRTGVNTGVAHYDFPASGDWKLEMDVQTSPIRAVDFAVRIGIH